MDEARNVRRRSKRLAEKAELVDTAVAKRLRCDASDADLAGSVFPVEVWIRIILYLPLTSCIRLTGANRAFRNVLLRNGKVHVETKPSLLALVREHYQHHMPKPPLHINEARYLSLVNLKACGWCGKRRRNVEIHWSLQRRLCHTCLVKNCISATELEALGLEGDIWGALPRAIIDGEKGEWQAYYWREELFMAESSYYNQRHAHHGKPEDWERWKIQRQSQLLARLNDDIVLMREWDDFSIVQRIRNEEVLQERHQQIISRLRDEKWEMFIPQLRKCKAFYNAFETPRPFTEKAWQILKKKLQMHLARWLTPAEKQIQNLFDGDVLDGFTIADQHIRAMAPYESHRLFMCRWCANARRFTLQAL
ncbi:hypothetical protein HDU85_006270 [Gaertneriomyces sp. JEL0708]|nr:hypothetical protein HDU85_006270 [Gaertneriomyces sp. JEL0708]